MRHFVIGNGSSLNVTPLDKLKGEITWAMNRIHLIYNQTSWRPTYYFMVDHNALNAPGYWKECVQAHWETPKWLWEQFKTGFPEGHPNYETMPDGIGDVPNTTWIPRCERHHYYSGRNGKRIKEWHFPEICAGLGGISAVIQLSVLNGATEIYVVGCDLYESDYDKNFFVPNYADDTRDRSETDNLNMTLIHQMAKMECGKRGIPIFNATIGGSLEVYDRVDLLEIL